MLLCCMHTHTHTHTHMHTLIHTHSDMHTLIHPPHTNTHTHTYIYRLGSATAKHNLIFRMTWKMRMKLVILALEKRHLVLVLLDLQVLI